MDYKLCKIIYREFVIRQFVGYELDKKYFDLCVERIEHTQKNIAEKNSWP